MTEMKCLSKKYPTEVFSKAPLQTAIEKQQYPKARQESTVKKSSPNCVEKTLSKNFKLNFSSKSTLKKTVP